MAVYKTTVRFSAEELVLLRKAAGDAPIPRYVRLAALRDAERKVAPADGKGLGDPFEGTSSPPFSGEGEG